MAKLKFTDVIDVNSLQNIQDAFSNATGMAAISVDLEGNVTRESNFTDFCIKYTRGTKEGMRRCLNCDLTGANECKTTGKPAVYHCHSGLIDFAVPVVVDGEQIGSIIGGQALAAPPDEEKFRKIALEIGVDPDEYINALRKVPIVPENKIRAAADLLGYVVENLVISSATNYNFKNAYEDIISYTSDVNNLLNNFYDTSDSLSENQNYLITEIGKINNLLKQINNIVKSVSNIAEETQMISFNASIEAARAGEQGKSFTVIAGEIRRLSEKSKKTVSNIQNFTANIQSSIEKTTTHSQESMENIQNEIEELNMIKDNISNIQKALDSINNASY